MQNNDDDLSKYIKKLDINTNTALDSIWKKQVNECVTQQIVKEWDFVEYTSITEPKWGTVVNK